MAAELPLEIPISGEALRLISEVDRYQGVWASLRCIANKIIQKFQLFVKDLS